MTTPATAVIVAWAGLVCSWPGAAAAQDRFEVAGQVTSAISSEFDRADAGVGGRLSWHPRGVMGVETEVDVYPGNFPDRTPFSRSRIETLFGVTVGPRLGRIRPFARLRPGFVVFREAPHPVVCILIFPPPLSCVLASGRTLLAVDVGGGVELSATRRTSVRVDVGDRLLKYPGPAFDSAHAAHADGFLGHDFRLGVGAGWRF